MGSYDIERIKNRTVVIRDRTGAEYRGVVKEIFQDAFVIANGDGTTYFIPRRGANVVSIRVFP